MAAIPQSVFFPRLKPKYHVTQASRHQESDRLIAIDSPASSETVAYVVCNDAAQVSRLTKFLSSQSIRVRAFRTATDYISNARSDLTACVILDLNLPDIGGLEVQSRLVEVEGPPVIFVAAHSDLNSGVRAIKNGAIDFMIEPIDYSRLLLAVFTALAQERNSRRERVERSSLLKRWVALTPREQDVFQYTVAGFLNKQAAAELDITENTFQVHRGRVMRKMEADSLADLVRMSIRLETLVQSQTKPSPKAKANSRSVGASRRELDRLVHIATDASLPPERGFSSCIRSNQKLALCGESFVTRKSSECDPAKHDGGTPNRVGQLPLEST